MLSKGSKDRLLKVGTLRACDAVPRLEDMERRALLHVLDNTAASLAYMTVADLIALYERICPVDVVWRVWP